MVRWMVRHPGVVASPAIVQLFSMVPLLHDGETNLLRKVLDDMRKDRLKGGVLMEEDDGKENLKLHLLGQSVRSGRAHTWRMNQDSSATRKAIKPSQLEPNYEQVWNQDQED